MRKTTILLLLGLFVASFTEDPLQVSVREVLSSVRKEQRVIGGTQTLDFLNHLDYRIPFLGDLGVRYGSDDITNAQRQFAMLLGFNSPRYIREQAASKAVHSDLYMAKNEALLAKLIKDRYQNLMDAYCLRTLQTEHKALDSLLNQKNEALKTSLQQGLQVRVKDLVENEEDLRDLRLSLAETDNLLALRFQCIRTFIGAKRDIELRFEDFITPEKVKNMANSLKITQVAQVPELKLLQSRTNVAQSAMRVEDAKYKQVFSGLQLVYERKNKQDPLYKDFAFRVSFKAPLQGNFRPKKNELLLDIKDAENAWQYANEERYNQVKNHQLTLENRFSEYNACLERLNSSLAKRFLDNAAVRATLSAIDIIDLKIIQQKKKIEAEKAKYALLQAYISLLDLTGDLAAQPCKNYLSNGLEKW